MKIFPKEKTFDDYVIQEVRQLYPEKCVRNKTRVNLLITSVNRRDIFAGIKTAVDFFYGFSLYIHADMRIIALDRSVDERDVYSENGFKFDKMNSRSERLIVDLSGKKRTLSVSEKDIFITTMWHTAYASINMMNWYKEQFGKEMRVISLLQDYEAGFYPWSSRYVLAQSTYQNYSQAIAVFNSHSLKEYFEKEGYFFRSSYVFSPRLNGKLKEYLLSHKEPDKRKKRILIYGRPTKSRNAFEVILMALEEWYKSDPEAHEWEVYSAGQSFKDIKCPSGLIIQCLGKLSLEEYADFMLHTRIGISLMISPHPSYPPLEMAAFGIKVITNCFANKDLSSFSPNIISLESVSTFALAQKVSQLIRGEEGKCMEKSNVYLEDSEVQWKDIFSAVAEEIWR